MATWVKTLHRAFSHTYPATMQIFLEQKKGQDLEHQHPTHRFIVMGHHRVWRTWRHVKTLFWAFSHDITVAILVSQTSPVGVELFSYVNALILFQ